jgi:alkanesulfonate monooxygenase SsuD/methylene tetrahydromethanopterin reductase-like flavin-dependent oxidoreductase (luciferase family)
VPWGRRYARLDDTVALWRQLWNTKEPSSFHGSVLHLDDIPAGIRPFDASGPPVWLAADTPGARARTGRLYDGWLPYPPTPQGYASGLTEVRAAARGAGRAADAVTPALFVSVLITDDPDGGRGALDHFATQTYGFGIDAVEQIQTFAAGTPDAVATRLASYIDAGARHLVCRIAVLGPDGFMEQLRRLRTVTESLR